MNLTTMRQIADLPNRRQPQAHAVRPARARAPAPGRSLSAMSLRVLPAILAVFLGGQLLF
jgi:hypothetical protein